MKEKELLRKTLICLADNLDNSEYTESELNDILDSINQITQDKLSKYQACKYLNISRATFDNYVKAGKIPEGVRQIGFKEKF